jgi:hypothetical protein
MPEDCNLTRRSDNFNDRVVDDSISLRALDNDSTEECESPIPLVCNYRITEDYNVRIQEGSRPSNFRLPEDTNPASCCPPPSVSQPDFDQCIHTTEDEVFLLGSALSGTAVQKVWEQSNCPDIVSPTTPAPEVITPTTPAPIEEFCTYTLKDSDCQDNPPLDCVRLKRVITGQNSTVIQANDNSYVLQVEANKFNRKYKVLDPRTNYWLGGMFPSEDFIIDDYFANEKLNPALPDSMDFRGPLGKVSGIAQCGDFSILFKTDVTKGNHWQEGTDQDNYVYENLTVAVYDMDTLNNIDTCYTKLLSATDTETFFENTEIPPKSLSGISWGFLTDAPVSLEYYDFDEARLYGASFKCKNPWNLSYDVSAKIDDLEGTGTLQQNASIEDVRNYKDMRVGAGQPWLAYKVRDSYSGSRVIDKNATDLKEQLLSSVNVTLSGQKTDNVFAYEHIERIAGIKRNIPGESHKSNIFSIRIKDSGLNEAIEDTTVRAQTQDGLDNVIREVVERISPAHTQLWKIIWQGR